MRRKTRQIAFQILRDMPKDELAVRLSGPPEEAAASIASAARFGLVEAQLLFGQVLLDGRGTPRDPAAAVLWFGAAASAGSAEAMNMLGRCHEMGWGVRSDCAVAAVWYARAADHGLDWAQYNLANLTLRGRGVAQDRRKALSLYLSAARSGHAKSMNMIGRYCEEGWEVVRDTAAPSNGIGAGPKGAISALSTTLAADPRMAGSPRPPSGWKARCAAERRIALHGVRRIIAVRGTRAARRRRTCRGEIGVIAHLARVRRGGKAISSTQSFHRVHTEFHREKENSALRKANRNLRYSGAKRR